MIPMAKCGLHGGITLEFLSSGMEIRPLEVDIRLQRRNYAHGQFVLSEEAGKYVAQNHDEAEPVHVKFDGNIAYRMCILEDAISFETNLDEDVEATLDLHDAIKVLSRGSVSKSWEKVNVRSAVEYIMDHRDDPNFVIQDFGFVTQEVAEERLFTPNPIEGFDLGEREANAISEWIIGIFSDSEYQGYGGFDFENVTPLEMLTTVMNEFGVNWWVEDDGTVMFGPDATYGQTVATVSGNNTIALQRYSVTEKSNKINAVRISGPQNVSFEDSPFGYQPPSARRANLQPIVEAKANDIEGSSMYLEAKRQTSLETLEQTALRALLQEVLDDTNGSFVINGLASTNIPAIAALDVGDHVFVGSGVEADCNDNVVTGHFVVREVHHQASTRRGWRISVEVARVPDTDQIETSSFFYDPLEDKKYDSIETFNEKNAWAYRLADIEEGGQVRDAFND